MAKKNEKGLIGQLEQIEIHSAEGMTESVLARIDTGASISSLDLELAAKLQLGPIIGVKKIKSANGVSMRPVVEANVSIGGKTIKGKFTVFDRSHMRYRVLIGRNILKGNFVIDPEKRPSEDS